MPASQKCKGGWKVVRNWLHKQPFFETHSADTSCQVSTKLPVVVIPYHLSGSLGIPVEYLCIMKCHSSQSRLHSHGQYPVSMFCSCRSVSPLTVGLVSCIIMPTHIILIATLVHQKHRLTRAHLLSNAENSLNARVYCAHVCLSPINY